MVARGQASGPKSTAAFEKSQLSGALTRCIKVMPTANPPVAVLSIKPPRNSTGADVAEPVYGGYANGRGDVVLFTDEAAYGVNFKKQTLQPRPQLNPGAQARYDRTQAGDDFQYGNKTFRRLSEPQVVEICESGAFTLSPRQLPY